jgi:hypothetical protein
MSANIRLADTQAEREAAFRFRYDVYVSEMNRSQAYADHILRRIEEPLDANGSLFIARGVADQIVGTVRVNFGCDGGFSYYRELYQMEEFGGYFPHKMSITTKLMVTPEYRMSLLPMQLACACFKLAMAKGVRFDIIDCNLPLKGFFEKLGYRQVFDAISHPEYGDVIPMVISCFDLQHLDEVRSPFRKFVRGNSDETGSVEFFRGMLLHRSKVAAF